MRTLLLSVATLIIIYVVADTFGTAVIETAEQNLNLMTQFILEQLMSMFSFVL